MHSQLDGVSASADAASADARVVAPQLATTTHNSDNPPADQPAERNPNRTDDPEVRRLRHRLLKLILENRIRSDEQSRRGLPVRSVG